jgi:hypothetical protein
VTFALQHVYGHKLAAKSNWLLNFKKHDCGQEDWLHSQVGGNGLEYGCWHTLNQHMLSWGCHACILHYHLAGNTAVTAAPTSSANRSRSEPSGISQVVGVYSVVLSNPRVSCHTLERVLSTATATKSWQRRPHINRRTKSPAETFHQWLVWYCSWLSKRMNVFPASLTGPDYMNILDSHYQNCWRMCHTPWESSSFHYGWTRRTKHCFPACWYFLLASLLICPKSSWLFHLGTPQMSLLRDSNRMKWLSSTQDPCSTSSTWQHTMTTR